MDGQQFNAFIAAFQANMAAMVAAIPAPAAPGAPTPKISVKIPTFKGAPKENVMLWMLQVLNLFNAQGIVDEQTRIHYAATGFEGAALHWYLNLVAAAGNNAAFADWTAFATALRTAFQPPNFEQYIRQQIRNLRQTGSIQDYTSQFRNLVGQTTNMGEQDQITYYIEGLKPATKMEVSYRAPATFEDAWKTAIQFDTAMFGLGRPTNGNYHQSFYKKFDSSNNYSKATPMELDYAGTAQGNNKGYNQQRQLKGNCRICGKPGHWKNECPQRNSGNYHNKGNNNYHNKGNNNYKNKGKFNNLEDATSSSFSSSSSSSASPNYNNNLELTNAEGMQEQLLRIKGKINGHSAWILLDSDASRNFLDKKFVEKCKLPTQESPSATIELADG